MMEMESTLFDDCQSVSNVKLVCKDGVISSHKILIASNSEFLKSLMEAVPVGDKVTIHLPDFLIRVIQPTLCEVKIANGKANFDPLVNYSKTISQQSLNDD